MPVWGGVGGRKGLSHGSGLSDVGPGFGPGGLFSVRALEARRELEKAMAGQQLRHTEDIYYWGKSGGSSRSIDGPSPPFWGHILRDRWGCYSTDWTRFGAMWWCAKIYNLKSTDDVVPHRLLGRRRRLVRPAGRRPPPAVASRGSTLVPLGTQSRRQFDNRAFH